MTVFDELTDEERAIVAFLETYFEKQGMRADGETRAVGQ